MSKTVAFRLPDDVADALQHEAERRDVEPSEVLREAVTAYLDGKTRPLQDSRLLVEVLRTRALVRRVLEEMTNEERVDQLVEGAYEDAALQLKEEGQL
jgi:hypothetical protein